MKSGHLLRKKITDLVNDDHWFAQVVYFCGIPFCEYPTLMLGPVCLGNGLAIVRVETEPASPAKNFYQPDLSIIFYRIDLIIEYLALTFSLNTRHLVSDH